MANYPTSLPSATPADHAEVLGEVRAIASTLGLSPQGSFTDVVSRLTNGATRDYTMPTGAVRHTAPRGYGTWNGQGVTSGTLSVAGFSAYAGDVLSAANVRVTTSTATGTHAWAVLLDSSRVVLAVSPDNTTAAFSANTNLTFTFGSAYTVATSGLFYVGLCIVAGTIGAFLGPSLSNAQPSNITPAIVGTSSSGQTTPPAVAATMGAITATGTTPYFWLT